MGTVAERDRAAGPLALLTNMDCRVDLDSYPPRSLVVLEMVQEGGTKAPPAQVAYEARRVVLRLPGAVLNMPDGEVTVHDGLIERLTCLEERRDEDTPEVRVTFETPFHPNPRLGWEPGLPARLVVAFGRSGPARVLAGRVLGLDPGHGGADPGAVGVGYREADIALDICRRLARWLEAHQAKAILTRSADEGVRGATRANLLRLAQPHASLSVHMGASPDGKRRGTAVAYRLDSESRRLAGCLRRAMSQGLPFLVDNGLLPSDEELPARLEPPVVVVLPEYITCHLGEGLLRDPDFRARVAQALFVGLVDYFRGPAAEE